MFLRNGGREGGTGCTSETRRPVGRPPKEKGMRPILCVPKKMMAGKGAIEARQRPEIQVEDPKGEGDETSALCT